MECTPESSGCDSVCEVRTNHLYFGFRSVPSFGIGPSTELGMPRNEHFLPRNNGNRSESIPRNFSGTKFRSQPYAVASRRAANLATYLSNLLSKTIPYSLLEPHTRLEQSKLL